MSRDYGSYFEDRLTWWFIGGQFYYKNPIQGLAETFAPVIYETINFLYNDDTMSLYDELQEHEKNTIIEGIPNIQNVNESINIMQKYKEGLLYYDWDSVLMYMLNNTEYFEKNVCQYVYFFIDFKSKLMEKIKDIQSKYKVEQIVDKKKIDSVLEKLKDYGITETHWVSRVFKNHWKGSCHDILLSPLFTLVNIGKDISRNIKQISDILYSLDEMPNVTQRSILVVLKERIRIFDEIGLYVLDTIYNEKELQDNMIYLINQNLIKKGISPKHRYWLNDSMYWVSTKGCLRNTYKIYDETNEMLSLFQSWQPFGMKLLLDYPY
jgi:hypothetical protein